MESGYACFCGNDLDYRLHGEAASSECNHVCFGDHTQPCGGDGRVIVFDSECGAHRGWGCCQSLTCFTQWEGCQTSDGAQSAGLEACPGSPPTLC